MNKIKPTTQHPNIIKNNKGMSYLEILIALTILAIIGNTLMPLVVKIIQTNTKIKQDDQLTSIASYVYDYINNWIEFDPASKLLPLNFYTEGSELELSGDLRVNHLQFMEPITISGTANAYEDNYKTSIKLYERVSPNRAVVKVKIWYDSNLNDIADPTENKVTFTTIITEKRN